MKNLFKYLVFTFVMLSCANSFAYPGGPVDPRDAIDQYGHIISSLDPNNPMPQLEVQQTTYFKLCEIRRFFCGKIQTVLVAAAIFVIGVLLIVGKISWTSVIVIITGIAIFVSAEYVTLLITKFPPNIGVIYSCFCLKS